jgi:hypothetical protein
MSGIRSQRSMKIVESFRGLLRLHNAKWKAEEATNVKHEEFDSCRSFLSRTATTCGLIRE